MGTIRKQTIVGSVYTYLGALVGFISTLLIPKVLDSEQIGLISILVSYATILATLASLGMPNVIIRYFPYFRDKENKHNGFLFNVMIVSIIGFLISLIVFFSLKIYILSKDSGSSILLKEYINYIIPLVISILYFNLLDTYYRVHFNVVLGTFLKEFFQRIVILLIVTIYYYNIFSFRIYVILYQFAFILPLLIMILSLVKSRDLILTPKLSFVKKRLFRSMVKMGAFSILSAFSGIVIVNIDRIMIERMMGLSETGIYTILFFFGTVIILPSRPLIKISSAFITEAFKKKDFKIIKDIYYKSTINQMIIGVLVLIGVCSNLHNLFKILPEEYSNTGLVILFIGLAFLSDMVSGVNGSILINSKHYRLQSYFMLLLIVLVIVLNLLLIPLYGLVGAAAASAIAKFVINLIRVLIVKKRLNLFPYKINHVLVIILGVLLFGFNMLLPVIENLFIDIFIRSISLSFIFIISLYYLKISEDLNVVIDKLKKNLLQRH